LAEVYKGLMDRAGVPPSALDDVCAGCGNQAGEDNRDVARMSVLLAGFPKEVPGDASARAAISIRPRPPATGERVQPRHK